MTRLQRVFGRLAADLNELGFDWAVVGGLAVSARAEPRTTRDVDVAVVATGDRQAEQVVSTLTAKVSGGSRARESLALITERGYDRDKDLLAMFEAAQARTSAPGIFVERKPEKR